MIETYFDAATLARLPSGATGALIEGFASSLRQSGFAESTARGHLRAAAHVCAWLAMKKIAFEALDEETLDEFAAHLGKCRCFWRVRGAQHTTLSGANRFLTYLRDRGVTRAAQSQAGSSPKIIESFERWMLRHRGVTHSTLIGYRPILVELVVKVGGPEHFTVAALRGFVSDRAARHGRSRAKTVVAAVRMLLRYCALQGLTDAVLVDSIPSIANWSLSSLPAYISREDVERVLEAPDPSTPTGRRDRAILLLLGRLGLRASDVVALRLADIDWHAGTLVVSGKGRRACKLPLPQDVGDAILGYLTSGRPTVEDDHVFLRALPPLGCLRSSATVSSIVCTATKRSGVSMPRAGAHVLRHSVATALVRDGVELPAIGVLLRHRKAESTTQYAKVDVLALRKIAQPWPLEVSPC